MKRNFLKTSMLVASFVFALQSIAGTVVSVGPFVRGDGDSHGTDVYTAYSFNTEKTKHNVNLELLWRLSKTDPSEDYEFIHYYLRSTITSPYKVELGSGWELGWSYRYFAPTSSRAQIDGSYGSVGFRPWITSDMGWFEFRARPSFYLYLQRESSDTHAPPGQAITGNRRFATNLEILPKFNLIGNLWFMAYHYVSFIYTGAAPGGTKVWDNTFGITPEIGYSFEQWGFEASVFYDEATKFGELGDFELGQDDSFEIGINLTAAF